MCVHDVPKGLAGGVLNVPEVSLPFFDDTAAHRLQLCLARSELTRHCWALLGRYSEGLSGYIAFSWIPQFSPRVASAM